MRHLCKGVRACSARSRDIAFTRSIAFVAAASASLSIFAQEPEQIIVVGERVYPASVIVVPAEHEVVDAAELLQQLPGANVNSNGGLTGIAQYRGMFGDRVAVSIDGLGVLGGGPNSMDPPLSYASPLLLDHLSIERGIASVWSTAESIGGHVDSQYDRGAYGESDDFGFTGAVQSRFENNGNLYSLATRLVTASDTHKLALLAERDEADDVEYPGGRLTPTRIERDHYDLSYAFRGQRTEAMLFGGRLDTVRSGTPALPMDIGFVETDLAGVRSRTDFGDSVLEFALSASDVDHAMDNFSLRPAPASPMDYRATRARADGIHWRVAGQRKFGDGEFRVGVDGAQANHSAVISNPNVAAFSIDNFRDVRRDVMGLYGQWNQAFEQIDIEAGLRINRIELDSGAVSASIPAMNPMMQMMSMNANMLAAAFNSGDRSHTHENVDVVFKLGRTLSGNRNVYVEVARKTRAPSYQEAYLWLPLQSTGGLADGRSYIGNPALDSEVSRELNFGMNVRTERAWFGPQVFFKDVDGYIQGIPSVNAVANMVATMMSGLPALEFANTDAEIYGLDLAWGRYLSDTLTLHGTLSYVRGRRTDVDDALYRLAPLNARLSLSYEKSSWMTDLEWAMYARQDRTSSYNAERPTAGYGIVNARVARALESGFRVSASIENLLDKRYAAHLSGINRVTGVDVPLGERLFGVGRTLRVGASFDW